MNKYINLFIVGFIVLWLNQAASTHDKLAVRDGLNQLFNEPDQGNFVNVSALPVYYVAASTNVQGWLLVINESQLLNLKVNLKNVTIAKLNTWRDNNLDNPNHLRWARGDSWEAVVATNGLIKKVVDE